MDQLQELQAAASALLKKAQDASVPELASAIEKVAGVLKLSSELEASQLELRKLELEEHKLQNEREAAAKQERSDRQKSYVAMLTPIVAIVTLAATIITQTYQTIRSEREKSDAALEAQWQDTLKAFAVITKLPAGIVELRPFLDSPKYGDRAREAVVEVLASSSNGELFTQLFGAFVPVRWNNLGYVLKIDRAIKPKAIATLNKANRTKDEQALADYYLAVIPEISEQVGSLLKTSRVAAQSVDLSDGYFFGSDWQGVDLSGADIENVRLDNLSLKGANLQITSHFGGASFFHVAWWQAQEISPVLRAYLQERYKCDPTQGYGPDEQERFTADQCSAAGAVVQPPQ